MEQDWKVVILGKKKPAPKTAPAVRKIENEELPQIKHYKPDFVKRVIAYRLSVGLSQRDLAGKIACREDVIRNLESGHGIYNALVVSKLSSYMARNKIAT